MGKKVRRRKKNREKGGTPHAHSVYNCNIVHSCSRVAIALAYNPAGPRHRGIMMELFAVTRPCSYAWSSSAFGATAPTEKRK
jgi:hypothetical protein